jgi:hypothetical protein
MSKIFTLLTVLVCCHFCCFSQVVPKNGRIAYYKFNGNANDSSGNSYHMIVNGPALCPDRFGRPNHAYAYDGVDDYLAYTSPLPQGSDFTYSVWFFSESFNHRGLILHNGTGVSSGIGILQNAGTTWPAFNDPGDLMSFYAGGVNYYAAVQTSLNTWHHLVIRCSGANYDYFYDNVLVGSGTFSSLPPIGSFYLGYNFYGNNCGFKGKIDDVTVYNRAITNAEVDTLFNGCGSQIATQPVSTGLSSGNQAKFFTSTLPGVSTYQWQIDGGTGYINLSNAGVFSGTNTDTLTITNPSVVLHHNSFRVVVTNDISCDDTSMSAQLIVCGSQITAQPSSLSVVENNTAKFFVSHLPGTVTYQWQMDAGTGFFDLSSAGPFTGTTSDTLTITSPTTALNNNNFRVILTNSAGCSDTSVGVKFNVWPTGIDNVRGDEVFSVYPNPSDGNFMIDLSSLQEREVRLEIYDLSGRKVCTKDLKPLGNVQPVSTGISQKGVYMLRVTGGGELLLRQNLSIR